MSKNQKTSLLLLTVVLTWGAIGFQIYSRYYPEIPELRKPKIQKFAVENTSNEESYTIQPDYRDPFLGKMYQKPQPKVKKKVPKPTVLFPSISYHGVIKGENTAYIIAIDGSQEIFQVKETIKGVTLVEGNDKEVTLAYQKAVRKYPIYQ